MDIKDVYSKIEEIILSRSKDKLFLICEKLKNEVSHYNWVGFYFMDYKTKELLIGPYSGAKTDHTRIPFGRGICGQVAVSGKTFVVQDVHKESNYLSCSINTKSEIVVPIYKEGLLIGQIDIDSHDLHPFNEEDEILLNKICDLLVKEGLV